MFSSTVRRPVATLAVVAGLLAAAVPAGAAVGPVGNSTVQPQGVPGAGAATTQGIIMRDGGVCDPIRHMGC